VVDTLINPYTRYWIENHNLFAGMWRDWESQNDHTLPWSAGACSRHTFQQLAAG
jgi:hypothetical protein